jgi:predicted XRE-type DNA-binding protein
MSKERWSKDIEEDLILLIKDWLKQTGRTQSELCQTLNLPSARMQTLIESLKKDFNSGGIPKIANRLCEVQELWANGGAGKEKKSFELNSSGQLDLLDEICEDLSKINFNT